MEPSSKTEHDNEGNLLTQTRTSDGQVTEFSWDYRNRLTQVVVKTSRGTTLTTDVFTIELWNRRIGNSVNGTQSWTVYDGLNPYIDFNSGGSITQRYINGLEIDQMFAHYDGTTTGWYLRDNINSVRELVKADGTVLDQIDYDSFGQITNETSPGNGDRFKFTGREWDSEIGLQFNRRRYYNTSFGGWISEDPIYFEAGDPNLYRYVGNRPTDSIDANGLEAKSRKPWDPKEVDKLIEDGKKRGLDLDAIMRLVFDTFEMPTVPPNPLEQRILRDSIPTIGPRTREHEYQERLALEREFYMALASHRAWIVANVDVFLPLPGPGGGISRPMAS